MKTKSFLLLAFFVVLIFQNEVKGQSATKLRNNITKIPISDKNWYFEDYKGQSHQSEACSDVKFLAKGNNFRILIEPKKIVLQLRTMNGNQQVSESTGDLKMDLLKSRVSSHDNEILSTQSVELEFEGCNKNCRIVADEMQEPVYNYYFNQDKPGITGIHTYKRITYKNIYPNIDLVLNAGAKGLKYEFDVQPDGKVSDIKLKWKGQGNFHQDKNGGLLFKNTIGYVTDGKPLSYQGGNMIATSFLTKENLVLFKTSAYDHKKLLVIDPVISWATYIGAGSDDQGSAIVVDKNDNIFVTGQTSSSSGMASSGVYQTNYGSGAYDAFLSKFNNAGKLIWTTYFGGNDQDIAYCDAVDSTGSIYISGGTLSKGISTGGAYQTTNNGGGDIFIAKFSNTGSLAWSTYFGGAGNDYTTAISIDSKLNVLITGLTTSTTPMATSGAYQTSNYGSNDAFLSKFNSGGSLQWSTLFGGTAADRSEGIGVDSLDNIFISGPTTSTGNIATSGAYSSIYSGGNCDSYIAKFDSKGSIQWSTYIGGAGEDAVFGLAMDKKGNPVIAGYAWSTSKIATSGTYQTALAGAADAFLQKFSNSGSLLWGTYEGGAGSDIGFAVAIDQNDNIFMTGLTQSTSGYSTSGAYHTSYGGGNTDGWISKFNKNGGRFWSTYYGGSGTDQGMGIAASKGYVYATGFTSSSSIATSGVYQTSYGGGANDVFLVKFQDSCFHHKVTVSGDKSGCTTANATYFSNSNAGSTYKWAVTNGKILSSATDTIVIIKWNKAPTGSIKITHTNILGCTDTNSINLKLDTFIAKFKYTSICLGDSTIFTSLSKTSSRSWDFGDGNTSSLINPKHLFAKPGIYTVKLIASDSLGCKDTATQVLSIVSYPTVIAGKSKSICFGDTASIGWAPEPFNDYSWKSSPPGYLSSSSGDIVRPSLSTVYYLTVKNPEGCIKSDSVQITVKPYPKVAVGSGGAICIGDSFSIGAAAIADHSYNWTSTPSGFTATTSSITVSPKSATTYTLKEIIISTGCKNEGSADVKVNSLPVANAGNSKTVCAGSAVSLGDNPVSGDSYSWTSSPSGFSSTDANPTINPTSTAWYYLTETNIGTGCKNKDSAQVTVNKLPDAAAGGPQTICFGDSTFIGFNAVTGHTYSWSSVPSGFGSFLSIIKVSPKTTTSYFLTETISTTGCQKTNSVKVTVAPLPAASVGSLATICSGDSTKIGSVAVSGNTYSWSSDPSGFSSSLSNPMVSPKENTNYMLTEVADATGCRKTNSVKITVLPSPDAHFSATLQPHLWLDLKADDTTQTSYNWNFGDGQTGSDFSEVHIYQKEKLYTVMLKVTASNGCSTEHDSTIQLKNSGIKQNLINELQLNIYPNPFEEKTILIYKLENTRSVSIELLDAVGHRCTILSDTKQPAGNYETTIQTEKYGLKPGLYLLKLNIDGASYSKTVIKL